MQSNLDEIKMKFPSNLIYDGKIFSISCLGCVLHIAVLREWQSQQWWTIPFMFKIVLKKHENIVFYVHFTILRYSTGICNPSQWRTNEIPNFPTWFNTIYMYTDDLVTQGARVSAAMVLNLFWNITASALDCLTHWGRDKMAAIFQTTFSNAFSWTKMN